jgi:hypothetical protein
VTLVPAAPGTVRHHLRQLDAVMRGVDLAPRAVTVRIADFVTPAALNVAMISSHQHRLGTRVTVWPVVGDVEGDAVYESRRWSEPPLRWLDPPIRLGAGDRLRVRCEWHNTTDAIVRYGDAAADEMCNLNGYVFHDGEGPPEERTGIVAILEPVGP